MDGNNDLGKILKQRRLMESLTLVGLAEKTGVSAAHIGRVENGERFPSGHVLRKLAQPLGFSETELLVLAGFMEAPVEKPISNHLDPQVAAMLAQEPPNVQRAVLLLLLIINGLALAMADVKE